MRDSLELCPVRGRHLSTLPAERFGIVSLHRFELLNDRTLLAETLQALVPMQPARRCCSSTTP